jgi:16S rRNA (guanine527-N7)-methyltransferase
VGDLDLGDRVSVIQDRAESSGRVPALRAAFDGVVARSFGPPATVAECAAPFLRVGGWLIVSEPPGPAGDQPEQTTGEGQATRWPAASLEQFGLEPVAHLREDFTFQILRQIELCPDRFPRRNGVPAKRPLF